MKLVVKGVAPWDGEYDFDSFTDGTNREYHRIKEISGVRAGELIEALGAGDTGAWVGFALMILARHDKHALPDEFWDAPENAIDWKVDEPVGDVADPPTVPPSGSEPSDSPGSSGTTSESGLG
jgi:hypothetical protein